MKTKIILTALLLLSSFLLKAQQESKTQAQPDSIIKIIPLEAVDEVVYAYTIGGKLQTRKDVVIKLMAYSPSAEEYHKSKNDFTWTWISMVAFGVSSFASI